MMSVSKIESIDLAAAPVGEWMIYDRELAASRPDVVEAVGRFDGLDCAMGARAANWLREHALENDPATRTHLLMVDGEVAGYFACVNATVELARADTRKLGLPPRTKQGALLLAWVARSRDRQVGGEHLILQAIGVAREQQRNAGLVAIALHPGDAEASRIWRDAYLFEPCLPDDDGEESQMLWLRID